MSKFSQASIFSGLNNLIDITLGPRYSALCGYTDRDLDKEKGYADKYRGLGQPIHLIGVEFSRKERNVAAFEVERTA